MSRKSGDVFAEVSQVSTEASPWTSIFIDDLVLDMFLGVHAHEKVKPQSVIVNLVARTDPPCNPARDSLEDVVSYSDIVEKIRAIAGGGHIHLAESFAERIACAVLNDPRVQSVTVRIAKPQACPAARAVGAMIHRVRSVASPSLNASKGYNT